MERKFKDPPYKIIPNFTRENRFPDSGIIKLSDNGSITGELLLSFVCHVDKAARSQFLQKTSILLVLDAHASRKGSEWLVECVNNNIEAVVNAVNTSHFLQRCDQRINKQFQEMYRELHNKFSNQGDVDTTRVNVHSACAIYARENHITSFVTSSFKLAGLFTFDHHIALQFKSKQEKDLDNADEVKNAHSMRHQLSSNRAIHLRATDAKIVRENCCVVNGTNGQSKMLFVIYEWFATTDTVYNIVQ